ncbi:MAG: damage-control phosphatase, subfamily, partial [Clostridiales bacterium]|nr:damage-control phosphatase, subfamily [Clostridiales bacterium]
MEIFLDCLPCVLKQVLEAARMSTQNQTQQAEIMEEAVKLLQNHKNYSSSPEIVGDMHAIVRKITGVEDPYKAIKDRDIEAAKQAYPMLLEFAAAKNNDLHWAVKIAATGNIIDSAIYDTSNFLDSLETELAKEFS